MISNVRRFLATLILLCSAMAVAMAQGQQAPSGSQPSKARPTATQQTVTQPTEPLTSGLSETVQRYVSVEAADLALVGVQVIDGTGGPVAKAQTILISDGRIAVVGPTEEVAIPRGAEILHLPGRTVIPGLVGTHNHLHMPGVPMLACSAPKLYLASGVTTIQTTGAASPGDEQRLADAIRRGRVPGPEILHTGPYFTGEGGSTAMIHPRDAAHIDQVIRRWTEQGVRWFKTYRHISPEHLRAVIESAHRHGARVTGHLCSVTYTEAARLGIDAIEHGFLHSFDHSPDKEPGRCSGSRTFRDNLDIDGPEVAAVHRTLIEHGVAMSSTPAIFETQIPTRPGADQRTLDAMTPAWVEDYRQRRRSALDSGRWRFQAAWLVKSMRYDVSFFRRGGLLTAGLDPGLHNLPGFGDQRNFELFVAAGLSPAEAVQVLTHNGAVSLGLPDRGTIEPGKRADLVVINGDPESDPSHIRRVETVLKEGIGYDPERLLAAVRGRVGTLERDPLACPSPPPTDAAGPNDSSEH